MINRVSLLSGVPTFLRPGKLELLSKDIDRLPDLDPLDIVGDLIETGETFAAGFLTELLLPLVSSDGEEILLVEETDS